MTAGTSKVKELKEEFLEEKDWQKMHEDWKIVQMYLGYCLANIHNAWATLVKYALDVKGKVDPSHEWMARRVPTPEWMAKQFPWEILDPVDPHSSDEIKSRREWVLGLLTNAINNANHVKLRLLDFKGYNTNLEHEAEKILDQIKTTRGKSKKTEKLDQLLAHDEQYAIQLSRNLEFFIEKLIVRLNHIIQLVEQIKRTLSSNVKGLGIPVSFRTAQDELRDLYQYVEQLQKRVDSFGSDVLDALHYRIKDALRMTRAEI